MIARINKLSISHKAYSKVVFVQKKSGKCNRVLTFLADSQVQNDPYLMVEKLLPLVLKKRKI